MSHHLKIFKATNIYSIFAKRINIYYWTIVAIRKHIVTKDALTCAYQCIRINKPTPFGIIVSALELVPLGLYVVVVTTVADRIVFSDDETFKGCNAA